MKSVRKEVLPRLEMRPRMVRPPLEICRGTRPRQAARSRPLSKAAPSPTAETMALAMIGPIPGTAEALAGMIRFGECLDLSRDFVEALAELT